MKPCLYIIYVAMFRQHCVSSVGVSPLFHLGASRMLSARLSKNAVMNVELHWCAVLPEVVRSTTKMSSLIVSSLVNGMVYPQGLSPLMRIWPKDCWRPCNCLGYRRR